MTWRSFSFAAARRMPPSTSWRRRPRNNPRQGIPAQRGAVLSRIEMVGGSVRMLDGDTTGARSALLRSLAWDTGNLRAALMLRKLEAGGQ